jgi:hypothetical protein
MGTQVRSDGEELFVTYGTSPMPFPVCWNIPCPSRSACSYPAKAAMRRSWSQTSPRRWPPCLCPFTWMRTIQISMKFEACGVKHVGLAEAAGFKRRDCSKLCGARPGDAKHQISFAPPPSRRLGRHASFEVIRDASRPEGSFTFVTVQGMIEKDA